MVLWYGDGFTLWGALVMVAIGSQELTDARTLHSESAVPCR